MLLDENSMAAQTHEFDHDVVVADTIRTSAPVQPEARTFGIPPVIWGSMAASYALFFGGLLLGTGHDGMTIFMIIISMLYTIMFFGTAYVLNGLGSAGREGRASQWTNGKFQTHTGPMSFGSVYGQMLVVPIMIGFWGAAIAVIRFAIL